MDHRWLNAYIAESILKQTVEVGREDDADRTEGHKVRYRPVRLCRLAGFFSLFSFDVCVDDRPPLGRGSSNGVQNRSRYQADQSCRAATP